MTKKNYSEIINNAEPVALAQKNTEPVAQYVSVPVPKLNVEIQIEEFYESGEPIIRHAMLEDLVNKANGKVKSEKLYISDNTAAFLVTISDTSSSFECIGETNPRNLTDARAVMNPIFMAWKRAYDKAAMRFLGINLQTLEEIADEKVAENAPATYAGYSTNYRNAASQMIPPQRPVQNMQDKVVNSISALPAFEPPVSAASPKGRSNSRTGRTPSQQPQQIAPRSQVVQQPQQIAPRSQVVQQPQQIAPRSQVVQQPQQATPQSQVVQQPQQTAPQTTGVCYENVVVKIGKYAKAEKPITYGEIAQRDVQNLHWCRNFAQQNGNEEQFAAAQAMLEKIGHM